MQEIKQRFYAGVFSRVLYRRAGLEFHSGFSRDLSRLR